MKTFRVPRIALALTLAGAAGAAAAQPGYLSTSRGTVVTTGSGLCVHTGSWTPAMAVPGCDAVPVALSAPAAAPAAAPPPAPEPTPLAQAQPAPQPRRITLSTDVLFAFDSAELRPGAEQELERLAQELRDARVERVVLEGHTDRIGSEAYNMDLSRRRAEAVRQWLAAKDLGAGNMQVIAKGENEPVTGARCDGMRGTALIECLEPNRRVEVQASGQTTAGSPASGGATR